MALGNQKFEAPFTSNTGILYKIQIFDEDYSGATVYEFNVQRGFQLTYNGRNSDRYQEIKASSIEFTMYIENSNHQDLINTFRTASATRYKVKILADRDGAGYVTYWTGVLVPDIASEDDLSMPRPFSLRAVDGLSLMKDVPFNQDVWDGVTGSPTTLYTFTGEICNLFRYYNPTTDFWLFRHILKNNG